MPPFPDTIYINLLYHHYHPCDRKSYTAHHWKVVGVSRWPSSRTWLICGNGSVAWWRFLGPLEIGSWDCPRWRKKPYEKTIGVGGFVMRSILWSRKGHATSHFLGRKFMALGRELKETRCPFREKRRQEVIGFDCFMKLFSFVWYSRQDIRLYSWFQGFSKLQIRPPFNGFDVFSLSPEASIQFWFGTDRAGRQILCILLGQRQGPWWSATEKFAMRHVTYTLQPIWHYDPVLLSSFLDGSYLASTSNPFIRIGMPDWGGFVG